MNLPCQSPWNTLSPMALTTHLVPSQKPERVPTKLATTAGIPVLRSKALRFARTGFGIRFGSDDSGTPVQEFLILEMVSMPCRDPLARFCGINKSWFSDVVI